MSMGMCMYYSGTNTDTNSPIPMSRPSARLTKGLHFSAFIIIL